MIKRFIIPIVSAIFVIIFCIIFLADGPNINSGDKDVLYKGVVYERSNFPNYGLSISEEHSKSIGDFVETYDYGQQLSWEVRTLNGEENVLYSAHAVWVRPGYKFPGEFGEEFSSVEYVVCEGIDFLVIDDDYKEDRTHLANFEGGVKLENVIESEPTDITEYTEYDYIAFTYKNHADMSLFYKLCSSDGQYYLNVRQGMDGTNAFFKIKSEYVDLLTSTITRSE